METGGLEAARQVRTLFNVGAAGGLTDGQLLDRFATRDGEGAEFAFAVLVERHGPMVLRACRRTLADPNDARDAFQATFVVLVRRASSLRVRDSLAPWLREVATRVAARARSDATRRRARERTAAERSPRAVADPDRSAVEIGAIVREEVERLPGRNRAAVVLCGLEGLTLEQAARQLGWPVGTVQSRLSRGRARLRDRLIRRGLAPALALTALAPPAEALPAALIHTTTRLAIRAAIQGSTGAIPMGVVALSQGVMRMMFVNQIKLAGLAVVASGLTFAGAVGLAQDPAALPAPSPARAERPVPVGVRPPRTGMLKYGQKFPTLRDILAIAPPEMQDIEMHDLRIMSTDEVASAAPGEPPRATGNFICNISYIGRKPRGDYGRMEYRFVFEPSQAPNSGQSPSPKGLRTDPIPTDAPNLPPDPIPTDAPNLPLSVSPAPNLKSPAEQSQADSGMMMGMMGGMSPRGETPFANRDMSSMMRSMMPGGTNPPADRNARTLGNQPEGAEETSVEPTLQSQARRLDELEQKIDRILKALETSPTRGPVRRSKQEPTPSVRQ